MPSVAPGLVIPHGEVYPFSVSVTEDFLRPGRFVIQCRWPDGFAILFQGDPCITEDYKLFGHLMEGERRRAELHPLALWDAWEWHE